MRRRRRVFSDNDEAEVSMTPLIDCVFLLLIFFLVTTVIKRKEKQIRVEMPDTTAAISESTSDEVFIIGLNEHGQNLEVAGKNEFGGMKWRVIKDLALYLKKQVAVRGESFLSKPIRIDADRDTPFQKAIDTLDICKLQGFNTVSIKIKQQEQ